MPTKQNICSLNLAPRLIGNLSISNSTINRVSSFKYLGILIQENLKWNLHIDSICRKITGISSVLNRLGNKVHHKSRIALYYSMVNSHLSYLTPVWSTSASQNDISRLQVAQNYSLRKIFSPDYYHYDLSTSEIMQKYKILNIRQLIHQNNLLMIYKIDKCLMKCNYRLNRTPNHEYATRSRSRPRLTAFRTNTGKSSVFRSCTDLYNTMPLNLRNEPTIHSFKRKLKKSILEINEQNEN